MCLRRRGHRRPACRLPGEVRRRRHSIPVRHQRRLLPQPGLRDRLQHKQRRLGAHPRRRQRHHPGAESDGVPTAGGEGDADRWRTGATTPTATSPSSCTATWSCNKTGVYRISDERNKFVVLGCNTVAWNKHGDSEGKGLYTSLYYAGCVTYCSDSLSAKDGKCAGVGCCHVDIPPELTDNVVTFQQWPRGEQVDFSPCDYAFLVDKEEYQFQRSDLKMDRKRRMPVWLDWAIRDRHGNTTSVASCPAPEVETSKKNMPAGYACVSVNSKCVNSTNGLGYYCNCSSGYEGNPYDDDPNKGCKGITLGLSFLIVVVLFTLMMLQKRKMNKYFKKNGGSVLQKVDNIMIFSKDEAYDRENSGRALFDKEIAIEEDVLILEEIGRLAMDCLKEKIEERPDMKEVAARLMMLRRSRNLGQENYNVSPQQYFEEISIEENCKSFDADIGTSSSTTLLLHSV
ncbi:hypothetical protein OsI_32537 [Oryza sativa Indica Group]|uniref:Uncharacterized protein n=1 Tax=Oryza sativa subsp. indica TaxID=39946 RepID=B8BFK3_ORYSI|nr:hypothetical protein OsI_32537 [Oryza sativa Indica Group]